MFLFCLVFAMFCARLFICASWSPAGKGLTSWLSFVVSSVSLSLSHWYPGSGVVLDCIDSWSLQPYLLLLTIHDTLKSARVHAPPFFETRILKKMIRFLPILTSIINGDVLMFIFRSFFVPPPLNLEKVPLNQLRKVLAFVPGATGDHRLKCP